MFDHVSLPVSDLAKSRAFYVAALAPLGVDVVVEMPEWIALGASGRAQFWIGIGQAPARGVHLAFAAPNRAAVRAFYSAALAAGGVDNGAPDCGRTIILTTTAHSCSTPTAIMSRRCAATPRIE
jgi:catechol 2,3-dioxygenase-like lactoylglutathione lyase family enzyme